MFISSTMHSDLTKQVDNSLPGEDDHDRLTDADGKTRRNEKKQKHGNHKH